MISVTVYEVVVRQVDRVGRAVYRLVGKLLLGEVARDAPLDDPGKQVVGRPLERRVEFVTARLGQVLDSRLGRVIRVDVGDDAVQGDPMANVVEEPGSRRSTGK